MTLSEKIIELANCGDREQLRRLIAAHEKERLSPEELFWLAFGQHALGDAIAAIRTLSTIESDERGRIAILYQRALYNLEVGDDAAAADDLREVLRLSESTGIPFCQVSASLVLAEVLASTEPFKAAQLIRLVPRTHEVVLRGKTVTWNGVDSRIKRRLAE
jgi:hypothetical protein